MLFRTLRERTGGKRYINQHLFMYLNNNKHFSSGGHWSVNCIESRIPSLQRRFNQIDSTKPNLFASSCRHLFLQLPFTLWIFICRHWSDPFKSKVSHQFYLVLLTLLHLVVFSNIYHKCIFSFLNIQYLQWYEILSFYCLSRQNEQFEQYLKERPVKTNMVKICDMTPIGC